MIRISEVKIPELPTERPRRLYVYLPRGYEKSGERYPVLYMFDGHNVFFDSHATYGKSWGMKEYLARSKRKVIVAAVECAHEGVRRLNEYAPWDFKATKLGSMEGLGRLTMEWFTGVLKPAIDSEYRTLPEREHTAIAGSSFGGIMALYAAVEYNAVYSRAAALSPSLWVNPSGMRELITSHELRDPTAIYIDMGTAEADSKDIRALFNTAKLLSQSGACVEARMERGAEHSEAYWEKRIPVFFDFFDTVS